MALREEIGVEQGTAWSRYTTRDAGFFEGFVPELDSIIELERTGFDSGTGHVLVALWNCGRGQGKKPR
jgi:hypothetical protein